MQDARLTQLIEAAGAVSQDQILIAQQQSRKAGTPLADALVNSGFISRTLLRDLQGRAESLKTISLASMIPDDAALSLLPASLASRHCVFPVSVDAEGKTCHLAVAKVHDIVALDAVRAILPASWHLSLLLATRDEILRAIDRFYGVELSIDGILAEMDGREMAEGFSSTGDLPAMSVGTDSGTQPVVRLVDAMLIDAVRRTASDIHLEPERHFVRIRYRLDGVMQVIRTLHLDYWPSMLVRLKVLFELNIAESRTAQDGHFSSVLQGRDIDFRISVFPTLFGENVVIRLLDRQNSLTPLLQLGFSQRHYEQLCRLITHPQGLLLVTGPTGSGKTTTLYSLLNHINSNTRNIMTLEDPVEYQLAGVRQCAVGKSVKLGFADGIRALLRQDPDVILVGETRDQLTSDLVARASLTGHLVLTTLHSASASGAFYRLQDLGMKLGILSETLLGILAQRLVRCLCQGCRQAVEVAETLRPHLVDVTRVYTAAGCPSCNGTGYRGRRIIAELLVVDPPLRILLAKNRPVGEIVDALRCMEHDTLEHSAFDLLREGVTSVEEIERVLGLPDPLLSRAS